MNVEIIAGSLFPGNDLSRFFKITVKESGCKSDNYINEQFQNPIFHILAEFISSVLNGRKPVLIFRSGTLEAKINQTGR
jgi:hypothetical protein